MTTEDCLALARLLASRRRHADALTWVDRGIATDTNARGGTMAGHDLRSLRKSLLSKLGRGNEALAAAWAEYRAHPGPYSYEALMRYVPRRERAAWHRKAIVAAMKAKPLGSVVDLLLRAKEIARLAALVRRTRDSALQALSHYSAEPAATRLEKDHPDLGARLWRAQGMRILEEKQSRHYDAALCHFERAKRCFERAGLNSEWKKTVRKIRARHGRKTGFMPGFEALNTGAGPSTQPSFLERAKARWGAQGEND